VTAGNHLRKIEEFCLAHPELAGLHVSLLVHHAEWCALFSGKDTCDCDPDVELEKLTESIQ
jgi:hypothetical protein